MQLTGRRANIEIDTLSGIFRVAIHPKIDPVFLLVEIALTLVFGHFEIQSWPKQPLFSRGILVWVALSGVLALLYQLTGSEVIEISAEELSIGKDVLGWTRKRQYRIEECRELQSHERADGDKAGLECKAGRVKVKFGHYLSEKQIESIFAELQRSLPEVAGKMLSSKDHSYAHFTTLKLT